MQTSYPFVEVLSNSDGTWTERAAGPRPPVEAVRRIRWDDSDPRPHFGRVEGVFRNLTGGGWGAWCVEPLLAPRAPPSAEWAREVGSTGAPRLPKLWLTDMDSTLIEQEVIDELAREGGRYGEVAAVTERAMRGELDFEASLRERVRALAGLPVTVLDAVRPRIQATAGADRTVRALRALGCETVVVSGGFLEIVEPFARTLGIDSAHANRLQVEGAQLTGRLAGPVFDAEAKRQVLLTRRRALNLASEQVAAVGDGANDLPMLEAAGVGVAFCAKPKVRERAHYRLDVRHLDRMLYLWGLSDQDIDRLANSASSSA